MNAARVQQISPGAVVTFRGETWRVVGLTATNVHLAPMNPQSSPAVWLLTEVLADSGFRLIADSDATATPFADPVLLADRFTLDTLTAREQKEVDRRLEIVTLARDGRKPGAAPDPQMASMTQEHRIALLMERYGVARSTIMRWSARFAEFGIAGLTDRRLTSTTTPWTAIDRRWRAAFDAVLAGNPDRSKVTDRLLVETVRDVAADMFGDEIPNVSDRQLLRYLNVLDRSRHLSKKTQRSQANSPAASKQWRPIRPTRPGEIIAVDSNDLDAFALDPITGKWEKVWLLLAVDVFSRAIVGWRFTTWSPNSQDVKLLIRSVITPKLADPSWPSEGLWRYTGVPDRIVAGLLTADPLLPDDVGSAAVEVSGVPLLMPDEIVMDHGKNYMSRDVREGCELLGITIGMARPYTPTDKSHVERVFRTVNTGFVQRLPGYKGPDIFSRGAKQYVEDNAFYTVDEIDALFARWVAVEYQNTPHDSLRHPKLPAVAFTPNQMIDWSMTAAGFVPIPVDTRLQVELLQTEWRHVSTSGIEVNNLRYDFPGDSFLDDYRGRPGLYGSPDNGTGRPKWRVKVDRRDLSRVWFFDFDNPEDPIPGIGEWREVPLLDMTAGMPFQERHLAYAKRIAVSNGGRTDRDAVLQELRRLLRRLGGPVDALAVEEKRLAAHLHAQRMLNDPAPTMPSDDGPATGDEFYEDTAPLTDHRAADPPVDAADNPPARLPQPYPTDEVDEWDPFDTPDIA
jgi:transposase InsO family protein